MKNQKGFTLFELMFAIVMILGIGGWVANIYKLASSSIAFADWAIMEFLRVVGIFVPPLGSVLGFF